MHAGVARIVGTSTMMAAISLLMDNIDFVHEERDSG